MSTLKKVYGRKFTSKNVYNNEVYKKKCLRQKNLQ